ncbi:unnamed protein product [Polarella glacialis]|uniref:16S rRNA (Cytosine(1402)-N(4))-methyltransferase n=1 Tax=Polarella glacialis TaxID=89957 RepID=A0A813F7M9_POLGL|nr:unnamed protein product [Polarella glacialis]
MALGPAPELPVTSRGRWSSGPRSGLPGLHETAGRTVLLDEAVEALMQCGGPDATYVDCTFGHGGHASEILRRLSPLEGRLVAMDLDPAAAQSARALSLSDDRLEWHHRPFGDLLQVVPTAQEVAGVLLDLGHHLSPAEERIRGFSFLDDVPLDLRLNASCGLPASEWLQTVSVPELAYVLHQNGEDWDPPLLAHRLAEAIVEHQRRIGPFRSSLELVEVCRSTKLGLDDRGLHPAKLTFQAIRAFLNQETEQLQMAMEAAMERLVPGGRLIIITYRRKEATLVKRFIRENEAPDPRFAAFVTPERLGELFPLATTSLPYACTQVCEPIRASPEETARNPRARPAQLHVLMKEERLLDPSESPPGLGLTRRPLAEQLRKPVALPFKGGSEE